MAVVCGMDCKVKEKQCDWIKYHIQLTEAERKGLVDKVTKGKGKAADITKAHVLLGSDQNSEAGRQSETALAASLHISVRTVERIRREFCERGMDIFIPKPHKIRADLRIDGAVAARIIALTCSDNLSAHRRPAAFYEVYEPEIAKGYLDRLEFVLTPKHGSWLDMAEI